MQQTKIKIVNVLSFLVITFLHLVGWKLSYSTINTSFMYVLVALYLVSIYIWWVYRARNYTTCRYNNLDNLVSLGYYTLLVLVFSCMFFVYKMLWVVSIIVGVYGAFLFLLGNFCIDAKYIALDVFLFPTIQLEVVCVLSMMFLDMIETPYTLIEVTAGIVLFLLCVVGCSRVIKKFNRKT